MIRGAFLLPLALAACQQSDPAPEEVAPTRAAAEPMPAAGDADHLALAPIQPSDLTVIADSMDNVGGCEFIGNDKRTLLSVGLPDSGSAHGFGVARAGGVIVQAQTVETGRGAVEAGPALAFEGITLDVAHRGGTGEAVGIETTAWPATLTVKDTDGKLRAYPGNWACGV